MRRVAVDARARDVRGDALAEAAGERPVASRAVGHVGERRRERGRHRRDAGRVLHARPALALAVVAARVGGDAHPAPHVERADARRSAELVRREREQVDVERLDVDREPADRLARVGVEPDVRLTREPGGLGDLLHRAQLVVRVLDAGEQRAGRPDLGRVPVHVDASVGVDRDHHDLEPVALQHVAHAADRGMLHRADHDARAQLADRAHAAPDRERDRLGAARREHDLVGLRADRPGDHLARVVEDPARLPTRPVDVQRIAERVERRDERVARRGQERRGRRRVEVDVPGHGRVRLPLGSTSDARVTAWPAPCPSGTAPSTRRRRGCRRRSDRRSTRTSRPTGRWRGPGRTTGRG